VNVFARHDIKGYFSRRPFQFIGTGALSLQKRFNDCDSIFIDKKHHLIFDSVDEFCSLFDYYVKRNPEEGMKIRQEGFEFCQRNHNYRNRMSDLMEVLSGKRDCVRYRLEDFS